MTTSKCALVYKIWRADSVTGEGVV